VTAGLAVASLRHRGGALAACALSVFLGATILYGFGAMLDTGLAPGVSGSDRNSLITIASVVGGWGLVIVLFSVASTLGLAVRQRATELAALRTIGMSNRQVRSLVRRETLLLSAVAGVVAVPAGWLVGRVLVTLLHRGHVIAPAVAYRFGPVTTGALLLGVLGAAALAAAVAARHATAGTPRTALVGAAVESSRLGRRRVAGALALILVGIDMGVLAATVGKGSDDPFTAMQFAGPASVYASLGLALLAPLWLRLAGRLVTPLLSRRGLAWHLATEHLRHRAVRLGAVLRPVVVFVGIGNGTLYLMATHESTVDAATRAADPDGIVTMLNYVVVGMVTLFAAIMVVNTTVSALADRRRELGRQRLLGATDTDVTRTVLAESVLTLAVGAVVGGIASLATIIPFALAKTGSWLPVGGPWIALGVLATGAVVTVGTSGLAVRRMVRQPALAATAA
jgi:putative ABC transport system permease protein